MTKIWQKKLHFPLCIPNPLSWTIFVMLLKSEWDNKKHWDTTVPRMYLLLQPIWQTSNIGSCNFWKNDYNWNPSQLMYGTSILVARALHTNLHDKSMTREESFSKIIIDFSCTSYIFQILSVSVVDCEQSLLISRIKSQARSWSATIENVVAHGKL